MRLKGKQRFLQRAYNDEIIFVTDTATEQRTTTKLDNKSRKASTSVMKVLDSAYKELHQYASICRYYVQIFT